MALFFSTLTCGLIFFGALNIQSAQSGESQQFDCALAQATIAVKASDPNVTFVVDESGNLHFFTVESRTSGTRKFAKEQWEFEQAKPDDLVPIEWLYHPLFGALGHTTLRVGNRIFEFTRKGWKIYDTDEKSARSYLFANPFFKRQFALLKEKGGAPFSIGFPVQVKKTNVTKLISWITNYPKQEGQPFSILNNNCNQCIIRAIEASDLSPPVNSGIEKFSSAWTAHQLYLQSKSQNTLPNLYAIPSSQISRAALGDRVPPYIYQTHSLGTEVLRVTKETPAMIAAAVRNYLKVARGDPSPSESEIWPPLLPDGPLKGKQLSADTPSIRVLSAEEAKNTSVPLRKGATLILNALDENFQTVTAELPESPPSEMSVIVRKRDGVIDHTFLRLKYPENQGVNFFDLSIGDKKQTAKSQNTDIVIDFSTWAAEGEKSFWLESAKAGKYGLRQRLLPMSMIRKPIFAAGSSLFEYDLKLTFDQRKAVIDAFIKRNQEIVKGVSFDYNCRHCTTELLGVLDRLDPNQTWAAKVKNQIATYLGRDITRVVSVLDSRKLIDPFAARRISIETKEPPIRRFKDQNPSLPISFGLELEFQPERSPELAENYRRSDIPESAWIKLDLRERLKKIAEWDPKRNRINRLASWMKKRLLIRLSGKSKFLPKTVTIEPHGTYEINGVVTDSIAELKAIKSQIESQMGTGSLQIHVVFPKSEVKGATGYTLYKTDESIITHLTHSYKKYLSDPKKIPARRLTYWALSPISENAKALFLQNENNVLQGKPIAKAKMSRLISGPVMREDAYPKGYMGWEERQFAEGARDLVDEADLLSQHLENGTLSIYEPYSAVDALSLRLINNYFEKNQGLRSASPALWLKFFKRIGTRIEKDFPMGMTGAASGAERFLIPFRNWREYPSLNSLDPIARQDSITLIDQATRNYVMTVEKLIESEIPIESKIEQLRIAIAKWASDGNLLSLFNQ